MLWRFKRRTPTQPAVDKVDETIKTDRGELYGIQMLRALAALAVVTHHTLEQSNGSQRRFSPDWLTTSGASGGDIFFVISGFIMLYVSFPQKRAPITAGSFLLRRTTRIYPFYWVCCLSMLLILAAGFLKHHHSSRYDYFASLLLLPGCNKLIYVSWTLVYEMYFYLIFAATLPFRSVSISVVGSTATIVCLTLAGYLLPAGSSQSFLKNPIPLEFCMGLWLAWAFLQRRRAGEHWPIHFIVCFIAFGLLAVSPLFVSHPNTNGLPSLTRVFIWGVPAIFIVAAFLQIGPPRGRITRFLVLLGDASYALYLTHSFVMIGYGWLIESSAIGRYDQLFVVPFMIVTSIIVALLAHLIIERPLLAMVRVLTQRQRRLVVSLP